MTKHADAWTPGIADLSLRIAGVNTWIEAKNCSQLPKREGTRVRFDHELKDEQAAFLMERDGKLMVRIQPTREYIGLDAAGAMRWWRERGWPLEELRRVAARRWIRSINWREMSEWLSTRTI